MIKSCVRGLERVRSTLFWGVDFLKGSKIKKHINEISFVLENFNHENALKIRQDRLKEQLQHSVNTTRFYSNYKDYDTIKDFPIINKNIITRNKAHFISETYRNKKNKQIATSGSTGTPFKINHNKNKAQRNSADIIYFSKAAGYHIGYKLLYLRHWSRLYKNSKIKNWMQNVQPIEVLKMSDDHISKLIEQLKKDPSRKGWLGFPSAFEEICKYLDKTNSPPLYTNMTCIIGMAEGLDNKTKQRMEYYFKAPMVSRYSNMENGLLAQQLPSNENVFIINWASYYIEVLNMENDEPAPEGTLGRIVVTDLFNYSFPLIRYDTGDVGILDNIGNIPVLKKMEGRKVDLIYSTKGNTVSPFVMTNLIQYKGIKQLQLIQETEKEYVLKLNTTNTFNLENTIKLELLSYLGDDATVRITYVNEIPLLDSGKRKVTINNYKKNL